MDISLLEEVLANKPGYRMKQAKKAVFSDLVESWQEVTVLPAELRNELEEKCPIRINGETVVSKDGNTVKALIFLEDGSRVESVLMRHKDGRNTVCVSCQIGCPLGCLFCATGKMGFKRNLKAGEIISQVLFFARLLKKSGDKVSNVVFMGMGEPFLNYPAVLEAIRIIKDKEGFNIGSRKISVSTVGIPEGIAKLAEDEPQVNLAVSLHAPNDELRIKLMPAGKQYTIEKVLTAVDDYIKKTNRRVMFEYLMIDGLNDSDAQAVELAGIIKKPLYLVNLISYNPVENLKPSSSVRMNKFKDILEKKGVAVTIRHRFGREVKGACGQLAGK
ncbi:MAG: 23S rRNA (adenine(2503)-C(2))-methyltransferase RlmN [Candidatus Pacebacteria bacterium]|jgi:23S rRNA (adenine2503-C2)-methyltransferase|nr:23S rRNA (adenine(2503)-C(2))-methyltransferase RlmN [Candidatus Paceibacterota bacterium]